MTTVSMHHWLQALGAARVAIAKMEAAGVPWRRPPDYYAEMVKTDDHMLKVREQLAFEQKQIEEAGQRWASAALGASWIGSTLTTLRHSVPK
jgi:Eukaryotic rRNA processing protein EBP2